LDELTAALSMPAADDVMTIHVKTRIGGDGRLRFEVNGHRYDVDEFYDNVVRHVDLTGSAPGTTKTLAFAGSQIAAGLAGAPSAAQRLAALAATRVLASTVRTHTSPDGRVLAATASPTADRQFTLVDRGSFAEVGPQGVIAYHGVDLAVSLRQAGFTVPPGTDPALPPATPYHWSPPTVPARAAADAGVPAVPSRPPAARRRTATIPARQAARVAIRRLPRARRRIARRYLRERDPARGRELLFRLLTPAEAAWVVPLAALARAAPGPARAAEAALLRGLRWALDPGPEGRPSPFTAIRQTRSAVSRAARVAWVNRLDQFETAFPGSQRRILRLSATLVDCQKV
jgi:hypothetical protein